MRRLLFPATWAPLLARDPQLFEPRVKRKALKEQNETQQDEVENQGNVKQRCV